MNGRGRDTTSESVRATLYATAEASEAFEVPDDRWARIPALGLVSPEDRRRLPVNAVDAFPMSEQQAAMATRMLMAAALRDRGALGVPAYHNVATSRLTVPRVEPAAFEAAGLGLVREHEMFRSMLDLDHYSRPMQIVLEHVDRPLVTVRDLRGLPDAEQQHRLAEFADAENTRTIDLTDPPLVTITVHLLSETAITLTLTEPHAIADGWSTHLNLVEFLDRYVAELTGRPPERPASSDADGSPRFRLREHSAQQLFQSLTVADAQWWSRYLSGLEPRSSAGSTRDSHTWHDSVEIAGQENRMLSRLAASSSGLKAVLLAIHLEALARLGGERSILTGIPVNTRLAVPNGVDARGMFLNVVPLRIDVPAPGREAVARAHRELMQVTMRGRTPLAQLARTVGRAVVPTSLFGFNSFHSIAGVAQRLGLDTLEAFDDWSHTDFPFEASFNRSEEVGEHIRVLLYSEGSPHTRADATAAYRDAVARFARLEG
ncbi:condensation domain-containing protein [Micromonospora sp. NPDC049081]|uniref:condensation domain-containing protein n=1 Tax=Micromonospora sp. NPDC049081 TaxID=3155150 RepID=UPI0034084FE2